MNDSANPSIGQRLVALGGRLPPLPTLLAVALAVRMVSWSGTLLMWNDGPDFLWQALHFAAGEPLIAVDHQYHPLFGAATALAAPFFSDLTDAAAAVGMLGGLMMVAAVWWMARLLLPQSPAVAWLAGAIAAVSDKLVAVSSDVLSDGLFLGLASLSCAAMLSAVERGSCKRRWLLAGVLAGLAYLTRIEGLALLLPPALWVGAGLLRRHPWQPRLFGAAVFFVAMVVMACPYANAIHELTGNWGFSTHPHFASMGLPGAAAARPGHPDSPIASTQMAERRDYWEHGRPRSFLDALTTAADAQFSAFPPDLALIGLAGLAALWRRRQALLLVGLTMLLAFFTVALRQGMTGWSVSDRYLLLPTTLWLPVVGFGWFQLWHARRAGTFLRVLLVLSMLLMTARATTPQRQHHAARMLALDWVRNHSEPDESILVRRRRDGWYADRRVVIGSPPLDAEALQRVIEANRVAYLVLTQDRVEEREPQWLEPGASIKLVQRFEAPDATTVLVLAPADRVVKLSSPPR